MLRFIRSGLAGLVAVAGVATLPLACQSAGVGDPCTPEQEYEAHFTGFNVAEAYIESRSFQCATRVCLVNHFQGRVSCPLGQSAASIQPCDGPDDTRCAPAGKCVASETRAPVCDPCDPSTDAGCLPLACPPGLTCDPARRVCTCDSAKSPTLSLDGVGYACSYFDPSCVPSAAAPCTGILQSYFCHVPGACQTGSGTPDENMGKACCLPGTDAPVGVPVCGQCDRSLSRDAASAVYCSCRCGVAAGAPPEPDFNFCACPSGFTCSEIRPDLHLGDPELTGKYCIKEGSAFGAVSETCGFVAGNLGAGCAGVGAP
jgi:hypothetical protein